jgi:hypothetical protein
MSRGCLPAHALFVVRELCLPDEPGANLIEDGSRFKLRHDGWRAPILKQQFELSREINCTERRKEQAPHPCMQAYENTTSRCMRELKGPFAKLSEGVLHAAFDTTANHSILDLSILGGCAEFHFPLRRR